MCAFDWGWPCLVPERCWAKAIVFLIRRMPIKCWSVPWTECLERKPPTKMEWRSGPLPPDEMSEWDTTPSGDRDYTPNFNWLAFFKLKFQHSLYSRERVTTSQWLSKGLSGFVRTGSQPARLLGILVLSLTIATEGLNRLRNNDSLVLTDDL